MHQPTPLFHGTLGALAGAVVRLPSTTLFLPCQTDEVLVVHPAAPLVLTGAIPGAMRGYVELDLTLRLARQAPRKP